MLRLSEVSDLVETTRTDVLSVSIDIDPTKPEHEHDPPAYLIWLRHALDDLIESLPRPARHEAAESAQRILTLVEARPQGRGVAAYAAPGLWRPYVLPVPLPNRVRYGRPDLVPLLWALDEYKPYAILAVDREHARILLAYLGRSVVVEKEELWLNTRDWRFASGRPPTFTRRAGTGASRGAQRETFEDRVEDHVRRFWAGAAEATDRFLREQGIRRLILGGPEEATSAVRDLLPEVAKKHLVAVVPLPSRADVPEIQDRTLPAALAAERRYEEELVGQLLERKGEGRAVTGLHPTLNALTERRAHLVVVNRDVEAAVALCPSCGYATPDRVDLCPACGEPTESTGLAQVLPLLARRSAADVEIIGPEASSRIDDGVGALLRYAPPQPGSSG